jgi:hypothetical protein
MGHKGNAQVRKIRFFDPNVSLFLFHFLEIVVYSSFVSKMTLTCSDLFTLLLHISLYKCELELVEYSPAILYSTPVLPKELI